MITTGFMVAAVCSIRVGGFLPFATGHLAWPDEWRLNAENRGPRAGSRRPNRGGRPGIAPAGPQSMLDSEIRVPNRGIIPSKPGRTVGPPRIFALCSGGGRPVVLGLRRQVP